jgi:N utilization substance protein B
MQNCNKKSKGLRRQSRVLALNMLYLVDVCNIPVDKAIKVVFDIKNKSYPDTIKKFSSFLIIATVQNLSFIDEEIKKHLKNWTMERLCAIDRNILRLATCEFLCCPQTPPAVIINEAIEIAKEYSTSDSGKFVNGVLDKVKHLRENKELISKFLKFSEDDTPPKSKEV